MSKDLGGSGCISEIIYGVYRGRLLDENFKVEVCDCDSFLNLSHHLSCIVDMAHEYVRIGSEAALDDSIIGFRESKRQKLLFWIRIFFEISLCIMVIVLFQLVCQEQRARGPTSDLVPDCE